MAQRRAPRRPGQRRRPRPVPRRPQRRRRSSRLTTATACSPASPPAAGRPPKSTRWPTSTATARSISTRPSRTAAASGGSITRRRAHVNFTATNVTRDGNTSRSQVLLDFNGDGKVDWLRSAPPGLVVDFGDGNGGFTEGSLTFTIPGTDSNNNASFLPADFDGDGKIDLLVLTGGNYDGTPGKTALLAQQRQPDLHGHHRQRRPPDEWHHRQGRRRLRPGRRHRLHRHREQVHAAGDLPERRPRASSPRRPARSAAWPRARSTTASGERRSRPISTTTASPTSSWTASTTSRCCAAPAAATSRT